MSVPPSEASPRPRIDPAERTVSEKREVATFLLTECLGVAWSGTADPAGVDNVLTSTTRWRAQRDPGSDPATQKPAPIKIEFTSTDGSGTTVPLQSATVTITGPSSVAPIQATFDPTKPQASYVVTWAGPWLTDPKNPASYLATGDYTFVIEAVTKDGVHSRSDPTAPCAGTPPAPAGTPPPPSCSIVSLVEVTSIGFDPAANLYDNPAEPPSGKAPLAGDPPYRSRPAAGKLIYAEATDSSQPTVVNNRVGIVAKTALSVPDAASRNQPLVVYFRSLDVADPTGPTVSPLSGATNPDGTPLFQDNRPDAPDAPPDFFDGVSAFEGTLVGKDGKEVPGGEPVQRPAADPQGATTTLHVARRQGNNYRVAASTSQNWLLGLTAVPNVTLDALGNPLAQPTNQTGAVTHTSGETVKDGERITEMLTVWRTLYLEVNRLVSQNRQKDQALLDVRGDFSKLDDLKDRTGAVVAGTLDDKTKPFFTSPGNPDHSQNDAWLGANLSLAFHNDLVNGWGALDISKPIPEANQYQVGVNDQKTVTVVLNLFPWKLKEPILTKGLKPHDLKQVPSGYILRDDEISSLDKSVDTSLAERLFAQAYIRVLRVAQPQANRDIPLRIDPGKDDDQRNLSLLYVPAKLPNFPNYVWPAWIPSSPMYWSTQLVSAFEGDEANDIDPQPRFTNDPNGEKPVFGVTQQGSDQWWRGLLKPRSAVLFETIRDLVEHTDQAVDPISVDFEKRVAAHEMLHGFGLIHDHFIMCEINVKPDNRGGLITDDQLKTIRSAPEPKMGPQTPVCPGP